jgi:regulator of sirC expression with transglutaminase-like and TPR domain
MHNETPHPQTGMQRLEEALASAEEATHDLGYLALLLAACHYPDLPVETYLDRLDSLAARARSRLGKGRTPARVITAINGIMFEEEGFTGNTEDYYDPRNSFLHEVLDRRTGIPISLSAVYVSIARRLGQPIVGVGMPLHFIVKYVGASEEIYIDPFHGGKILTVQECQERVERAMGAPVNFQPSFLDATPTRTILYRMLNNLKQTFVRQQEYVRAGLVVEQMLVVRPDAATEVRDRGLLYLREGLLQRALEWLARYLRENPEAPDAERIRQQIQAIQEHRARRN